MAGNTYRWQGGAAGGPDDPSIAANWLIFQDGQFVTTTSTPGSGDTAEVPAGTIDATPDTTLQDIAIVFDGSAATLALSTASLDDASTVTVAAGDSGTITVAGFVADNAQATVSGSGATLDILVGSTGTLQQHSPLIAESGGAIAVDVASGGSFLGQAEVALGGSVAITGSLAGIGLMVVGDGGVITVDGAVTGSQNLAFVDATGIVVIEGTAGFDAHIYGFQNGDVIDLPGIDEADLQPLTLNDGTLVISDGTHTEALNFGGQNLALGDFVPQNDGSGGTEITLASGVDDPVWSNVDTPLSGSWSDGTDWSTGSVPGSNANVIIPELAGAGFTLAASNDTVGSVLLLASGGTLAASGTFDVSRGLFAAVGSLDVTSGATLRAAALTGLFATIEIDSGALVTLSANGGAVDVGTVDNGRNAVELNGTMMDSGGTLNAAAGTVRIGWAASGQLSLSDGATGTASYTVLGGFGDSQGTLTLDDAFWSDTGGDSTSSQAGAMLVGGGEQTSSGFGTGGSGTLVVQDHATLLDQSAIIGAGAGSSGTAIVMDGALWSIGGNLVVGDAPTAQATLDVQMGTAEGGTVSVLGTVTLDGSLSVIGNSHMMAAGLIATGGSLNVDSASTVTIGNSAGAQGSGLILGSGAQAIFSGGVSVDAGIQVLGTAQVDDASFGGSLLGTGVVQLNSGGELTIYDATPWTTQIAFETGDAAATLTLWAPSNEHGVIHDFVGGAAADGNTIDLPGLTYDAVRGVTYDNATGVVTLGGGGLVPATLTLDAGLGTPNLHLHQDTNGGTELVENPCFLRGTHILTPGGEVPVETLRPGDLVTTLSGKYRALRWIGFGRNLVTPRNRDRAAPVVVRQHALGEGVPHRDLYITRGHSLFIDGVLIPVEELINHRSIAWVKEAKVVEFCHLELDSHDVVIAEGAAAETYREDENSALFHNAATRPARPVVPPCAPVLHDHPEVRRIWRRLSERAGRLPLAFSDDPDLHLLADGVRVAAESAKNHVWRFILPRAASELRIVSRSAIPSMIGLEQDQRRLGVALRRIDFFQGGWRHALAWDSPDLAEGFHATEPLEKHRWTTGDALLPPALTARLRAGATLALHVNGLLPYPVATAEADISEAA